MRPQDESCNLIAKACLTKYNFAVSLVTVRGFDNPVSYQLISEAATATSYLLQYRTDDLSFTDSELLKRLYWLCFAHQCTQALHGRPSLVFAHVDHSLGLFQPMEINDIELATVSASDVNWHGNSTSYIPGLNVLCSLFMLWLQSQGRPTQNMSYLQDQFELVSAFLDNIPVDLRWRGGLSRSNRGNFGTDVQTVNIYITQIHIRAFLTDQIDRAAATHANRTSSDWVLRARQDLVGDTLAIVYQMPEEVLAANGYSLIIKLRDIGLTLLSGNESSSWEVSQSLERLLAKLERLDFRPALSEASPSDIAL
ncbi:hypothetical protein BJY01DRAFT_247089 [Aspergillus pseudoustus]|uniref:Transcription factor domain-containing protein n=1 Tax=Aspergillus pseudoustus TaxID=1810923 RepID=A0ABR4K564_9EURO